MIARQALERAKMEAREKPYREGLRTSQEGAAFMVSTCPLSILTYTASIAALLTHPALMAFAALHSGLRAVDVDLRPVTLREQETRETRAPAQMHDMA